MARIKTIIKLRRDTITNYSKVGTHIPANGEVCLVDTIAGIKVKIGDGEHTFNALSYADSAVISGYYNTEDGKFYIENSFVTEIPADEKTLYINRLNNSIYYFDGVHYVANTTSIPNATALEPGIMKLYTTHGQNTDGTMTQKAITDSIGAISFDVGLDGNDDQNYLVLNKPW